MSRRTSLTLSTTGCATSRRPNASSWWVSFVARSAARWISVTSLVTDRQSTSPSCSCWSISWMTNARS